MHTAILIVLIILCPFVLTGIIRYFESRNKRKMPEPPFIPPRPK